MSDPTSRGTLSLIVRQALTKEAFKKFLVVASLVVSSLGLWIGLLADSLSLGDRFAQRSITITIPVVEFEFAVLSTGEIRLSFWDAALVAVAFCLIVLIITSYWAGYTSVVRQGSWINLSGRYFGDRPSGYPDNAMSERPRTGYSFLRYIASWLSTIVIIIVPLFIGWYINRLYLQFAMFDITLGWFAWLTVVAMARVIGMVHALRDLHLASIESGLGGRLWY